MDVTRLVDKIFNSKRALTGRGEGGYAPEYLKQIIAAYPQAWESYLTLGPDDNRKFGEWLRDHVQEHPDSEYRSLDAYQQKVNNQNAISSAPTTFDALEPLSEAQLAAVKKFTDSSAEHKKILNESFGGDLQKYAQWFTDWWQGPDGVTFLSNPDNAISDGELELLNALGFNMDGGQDTPLEQDLLQKVYSKGQSDMAGDAARQAEATKIIGQINSDLDAAKNINSSLLTASPDWTSYVKGNPDIAAYYNSGAFVTQSDGSRLETATGRVYKTVEDYAKAHFEAFGDADRQNKLQVTTRLDQEYANADDYSKTLSDAARLATDESKTALAEAYAAKQGALDLEGTAKTAAIDDYSKSLLSSLDPVANSRLDAARLQSAAINQGAESTRDQLIADMASQGYLGGSSMSDAALSRATIDARQQAANTMANARLINATDKQGIEGTISDARKTLADYLASGKTTLTNANADTRFNLDASLANSKADATRMGADLKQNYFDNDLTRKQAAATTNAQLGQLQLSNIGKADEIGWQGLDRTLDRLNWFSTSATPTTATATTTEADQSGSLWAGIGSGLLSGGLQLAASNIKSKTPSTGTGSALASSSLTGSTNGKVDAPST